MNKGGLNGRRSPKGYHAGHLRANYQIVGVMLKKIAAVRFYSFLYMYSTRSFVRSIKNINHYTPYHDKNRCCHNSTKLMSYLDWTVL